MQRCFVIQPFDRGKFDQRYDEILAPAVSDAGLDPYRVDRDPSCAVPVETIQREIQSATACVADVSTNNPNVWFEIGYAIARGKPIVLVCCEADRSGDYPFDVRHLNVIAYATNAPSDFSRLRTKITDALVARVK